MKKAVFILLSTFLLMYGCVNNGNNKNCKSVDSELVKNYTSLQCSNGYTIRYKDLSADALSIEVIVIKGNDTQKHEMRLVRSASGAKYQTNDEKYVFWSHHGDFTYFVDDKKVCSYTAPENNTINE